MHSIYCTLRLTMFIIIGISKIQAHNFGHPIMIEAMHPEDIKAELRKRYGSVGRFVDAHDLPKTGVSDLFRGRTSKRVSDAIEKALSADRVESESISLDGSKAQSAAHRLSAAGE